MVHELDNTIMLLIHPPLSILGYLMTFLALSKAASLSFSKRRKEGTDKDLRISLPIAWWLTFLGLVTGMIWAQIAWGTFWSWDPKETATLSVFLTLTAAYVLLLAKKRPLWIFMALCINVICILVTISMSLISVGLHSFG
jgi:cytochrome c biogenesis factor